MNNVYGKHVLVTGASRGIGEAVAKAFAAEGCSVMAVSRNCEEKTEQFPGGGSITYKRMNVSDEASVAAVVDAMERVDIAFLAAGMGIAGAAEEMPLDLIRAQMETNYFGTLTVGSKVLPRMREQGKGLLIVVGSIAGKVPIPMQGHYSSSKYALEAYVETVSMEMRPFGVRAVIVEPGDTKTGFTAARKTYTKEGSPYYKAVVDSVERMAKDEQGGKSPDTVAAVALKLAGKTNPPPRVAIGFEYKALMFILRFLPDRLKRWILTKMYLPVQPGQ